MMPAAVMSRPGSTRDYVAVTSAIAIKAYFLKTECFLGLVKTVFYEVCDDLEELGRAQLTEDSEASVDFYSLLRGQERNRRFPVDQGAEVRGVIVRVW